MLLLPNKIYPYLREFIMDRTALLQRHNLKATPQRIEIVNVLKLQGHLNIDTLYVELKKKFPSISLSTIYKNINTMIQKDFLSELKVPSQKNLYELIKEEHSHLICTECKKVMDICLNISELLLEAKNISGYTFQKSSIILNGTCPSCS